MASSGMRHLIHLKDYTADEIREIIDLALKIKADPEQYWQALDHKTLIMYFEKSSTRTRLSFEAGMTHLGGHAIFLDKKTTQFSLTEFGDEIRAVMRFGDILMYRAMKAADVETAASFDQIPVIDACSEKYHPCQALGDLLTMAENAGSIDEIEKIAWLGIQNNVSNTLKLVCAKLGIDIVLMTPKVHEISIDEELDKMAADSGYVSETLDIEEGMEGVKYVHTDTWMDMEFFDKGKVKAGYEQEFKERKELFMPFQLNAKLVDKYAPTAGIMHCMPCHVGYEITTDAINHPNSLIFDQAENRMHAQNAIMIWLLQKAGRL